MSQRTVVRMSLPSFYQAFTDALPLLNADVLRHTPGIYPNGPLIRVKVIPPTWIRVPPLLDPVGVVWYAQQGEYLTVIGSQQIAPALLGVEAAVCLLEACDLVQPAQPTACGMREELRRIVDAYCGANLGAKVKR